MSKRMTPTILTQWFALNKTHKGRDKYLRLVQYYFKFLSFKLEQAATTKDEKAYSKQVAGFSKTISTSRKLFRIGKWMESICALWELSSTDIGFSKKHLQTYTKMGKSVADFVYLWTDMFQWLDSAKIVVSADKAKLKMKRAQAWCFRIIFTLILDAFAYTDLFPKIEKAKQEGDREALKSLRVKMLGKHLEVIRMCLDFITPAKAVGLSSYDNGVEGIAGMVSSSIGVYEAWPASKK